jgi:CTP:molybdopterin cytidylyltransferase MocA
VTAWSAVVLAGSRHGGPEPVAAYAGVPHKALIRLTGETLLARVHAALTVAGAGRIAVVSSHPDVRAEAARLGAEILDEASGPSISVKAAAVALGPPLLITTADHPLLQPDWVTAFLAQVPADADVAALAVRREAVEAAVPGAQRTWIHLADGDWKGCNLFWLANDRALGVVDLWRRVEAERKHPLRMARILGPGILLRYATGRLRLNDAARRLGQMAGAQAAIVETPHGLASVDVDKPADLDLVRRIVGETPG